MYELNVAMMHGFSLFEAKQVFYLMPKAKYRLVDSNRLIIC